MINKFDMYIQENIIKTSVGELFSSNLVVNKDAPSIIFLHDSLGCTDLWRDFPEKLATITSCNAVIYDRQGYGKSCNFSIKNRNQDYMEIEAKLLNEVLDFYQINNAILFGHSDGGTISLIFGALFPERTKSIISVGAHIFVEEITVVGIKSVMSRYETTNLKQKLAKYHDNKTDAMFKAWSETWLSDHFRSWNITELLKKISSPVLAIQGENDEFGSKDQLFGIRENVSADCEIHLIENAGHSPHFEFPDNILNLSKDFILKHF